MQLSVVVPQYTARVALWCVGGDGSRSAGLAGWTDVSRLPQAGARTLLGADAVVNGVPRATRGPAGVNGAAVSTATVPAGTAAAGAGFVTTLLPADAAVVVVSVDPAGDDRDLAGLTLGLDGASRPTGPDGAPLPPTVVTAGARMHLLYAVVPAPSRPPPAPAFSGRGHRRDQRELAADGRARRPGRRRHHGRADRRAGHRGGRRAPAARAHRVSDGQLARSAGGELNGQQGHVHPARRGPSGGPRRRVHRSASPSGSTRLASQWTR